MPHRLISKREELPIEVGPDPPVLSARKQRVLQQPAEFVHVPGSLL